jgi:multiple sugar transport system ATP-binding protein
VVDGEFLVLVGPSACGKSTVLRMVAGLEDITSGAIYIDGEDVSDWPPKERETAHVLGLLDLLRRKPAALSGGQHAKLRVSMRGELTRLHQRYGITTLYVTHDQVEAMTLGDRIAVIDQGRLQQVGTPDELYFTPANRFVAGFMGSPSMNFATAQVRAGDPLALDLAGYVWALPDALAHWPGLTAHVDRTVVLGLRPDAFTMAHSHGGAATMRITPTSVESLGNEKHLLFLPPGREETSPVAMDESAAAETWTAKAPATADLVIGREVDLSVDLTKAYFFDPDTGTAIAPGTRAPGRDRTPTSDFRPAGPGSNGRSPARVHQPA